MEQYFFQEKKCRFSERERGERKNLSGPKLGKKKAIDRRTFARWKCRGSFDLALKTDKEKSTRECSKKRFFGSHKEQEFPK